MKNNSSDNKLVINEVIGIIKGNESDAIKREKLNVKKEKLKVIIGY